MDSYSSQNLLLQAQKKLVSTEGLTRVFRVGSSTEVLDELYDASREYARSHKVAQAILRDLVKVVVKLVVLRHSGELRGEELALVERLCGRLRVLAMTAVSFHQVDFIFNRTVMADLLEECRELLHQTVGHHLTGKSHDRIDRVFDHFSDCGFLAALCGPSEVYGPCLQRICNGLSKMLDEGSL